VEIELLDLSDPDKCLEYASNYQG
jgi:dehydrogenase/reductase SDR family protein 7B